MVELSEKNFISASFPGSILIKIIIKAVNIAYYAEKYRATRFIDLGKRYGIEGFIVNKVEDIDIKNSLDKTPDYDRLDKLINEHRKASETFLENALKR